MSGLTLAATKIERVISSSLLYVYMFRKVIFSRERIGLGLRVDILCLFNCRTINYILMNQENESIVAIIN